MNDESFKLVATSSIQPNRYQPRKYFNDKDLQELAESIDIQGLHQPIIVRPINDSEDANIKYELVAGERRWRAHKILELTKIKAIVREMDDKESIEAAITENLQRQDLNPMEEALSFKLFKEKMSLTDQQVADRLGKSRPYIANTLRLLKLTDDFQDLVAEKKIEKWHGINLLPLSESDRKIVAKKIIDKNLTVSQAKEEVDKILNRNPKPTTKDIEEKNDPVDEKFEDIKLRYLLLVDAESTKDLKELKTHLEEEGYNFFSGTDIKKAINNL